MYAARAVWLPRTLVRRARSAKWRVRTIRQNIRHQIRETKKQREWDAKQRELNARLHEGFDTSITYYSCALVRELTECEKELTACQRRLVMSEVQRVACQRRLDYTQDELETCKQKWAARHTPPRVAAPQPVVCPQKELSMPLMSPLTMRAVFAFFVLVYVQIRCRFYAIVLKR